VAVATAGDSGDCGRLLSVNPCFTDNRVTVKMTDDSGDHSPPVKGSEVLSCLCFNRSNAHMQHETSRAFKLFSDKKIKKNKKNN
jgi:hypothetical protein